MKVIHFHRKPHPFHYSIETLFEGLRKYMNGVKVVECPEYSRGFWPRVRNVLYARRQQGDVNHITGDVHYLAIGLKKNRTILTIHDCGFLDNKGWFSKWLLKTFWLSMPVRRSKFVTVISEATKKDVLRHLPGCPPEKIIVIPDCVPEHLRPVPKEFDEKNPVILMIGTKPNKNLERSLAAIRDIPCRLHLVGEKKDDINALVESYNIPTRWESNITNEEMAQAYAHADLLLFASTLEGFGMPILEAQTVGRPVVTSNVYSMPEVAGEGACLVDPYDVESIREGVLKVIRDREYREELVRKGFGNVGRFGAERVARMYEGVYGRVVEKGRS